jgi:hypothetical protein
MIIKGLIVAKHRDQHTNSNLPLGLSGRRSAKSFLSVIKTVVLVEGWPVGCGVGLVSRSCSVVPEASWRGCNAPAQNLERQVREGKTFELLDKRWVEVEISFGEVIAGERAYG